MPKRESQIVKRWHSKISKRKRKQKQQRGNEKEGLAPIEEKKDDPLEEHSNNSNEIQTPAKLKSNNHKGESSGSPQDVDENN